MTNEYVLRTGLSQDHWVDRDFRILYGCMNALVDFVDEEAGGIDEYTRLTDELEKENVHQYRDQIDKQRDVIAIYKWWTTSVRQDDYNDDVNTATDTEMLIRLMKVRGMLWI